MNEGVDIKIFTLNCWGIWGVSTHRVVRVGCQLWKLRKILHKKQPLKMRAIAQHLAVSDYDLVLLQVGSFFTKIKGIRNNKDIRRFGFHPILNTSVK